MNNWRFLQYLHCLSISAILLLSGCEKVFEPPVDQVGQSIVVEGSLSTIAREQIIKITLSQPYNAVSKYSGLSGAKVNVTDNTGKEIIFRETASAGIYSTYPDNLVKAEIGLTYTLHIKTQNGVEYESKPQTVVKCAPIDSLFCEYDKQTVIEQDEYGGNYQVTYDGIRVEENTKGLYPNHNFYLYSWVGYEEQEIYALLYSPMMFGNGFEWTLNQGFMHYPLLSIYNKVICTGNADDYTNQELFHNRLLFISYNDLNLVRLPDSLEIKEEIPRFIVTDSGNQVIIDTVLLNLKDSLSSSSFEGLILKLEQKSISSDAYLFWNSVQKQLDASDKLFDPVASQTEGNISCISDSTKKAYGVFYAYDVSSKYAWLYTDKFNNVLSNILESFPVVFPDSVYWGTPPTGWILP